MHSTADGEEEALGVALPLSARISMTIEPDAGPSSEPATPAEGTEAGENRAPVATAMHDNSQEEMVLGDEESDKTVQYKHAAEARANDRITAKVPARQSSLPQEIAMTEMPKNTMPGPPEQGQALHEPSTLGATSKRTIVTPASSPLQPTPPVGEDGTQRDDSIDIHLQYPRCSQETHAADVTPNSPLSNAVAAPQSHAKETDTTPGRPRILPSTSPLMSTLNDTRSERPLSPVSALKRGYAGPQRDVVAFLVEQIQKNAARRLRKEQGPDAEVPVEPLPSDRVAQIVRSGVDAFARQILEAQKQLAALQMVEALNEDQRDKLGSERDEEVKNVQARSEECADAASSARKQPLPETPETPTFRSSRNPETQTLKRPRPSDADAKDTSCSRSSPPSSAPTDEDVVEWPVTKRFRMNEDSSAPNLEVIDGSHGLMSQRLATLATSELAPIGNADAPTLHTPLPAKERFIVHTDTPDAQPEAVEEPVLPDGNEADNQGTDGYKGPCV
ncbi:hypothetical protein PUNSTDRAFT_133637 [Punctularia strigosozonata HHB-11173 SS5]|uniref:uncharacterized protein n=1 Tax=Punctularia strigosozonata (strain HHB-11173) TaxID=741275 RepID=UPI0004417C5B|nr:uncharacterized protein PUNSTDRAFT_133637 [Punctularia strigosozonata HHB-11173 SS5]EIN09865.1 hypothetical protein PUNSTDRAFT_133637 [Punctularia strigosozonata HHB-11173 SS5]